MDPCWAGGRSSSPAAASTGSGWPSAARPDTRGEWALDIDEGVMGDDFKGRTWGTSIRPASEVRTEKAEQAKAEKTEQATARHRERDTTKATVVADDAANALAILARLGKATKTAWRSQFLGGVPRFELAFGLLVAGRKIVEVEVEVATGKSKRSVLGYMVNPERTPDENEPY